MEVCGLRALIDTDLAPSVPVLPPVSTVLHAGIHILIPSNSLIQCLNRVNVETILPSVECGIGSQAQHAVAG